MRLKYDLQNYAFEKLNHVAQLTCFFDPEYELFNLRTVNFKSSILYAMSVGN